MANYNSADQLRSYANLPASSVVSDDVLDVYLTQANLVVTEDLAGSGFSNERLTAIELNLAAHFYTVIYDKGGITQKRIGQSEERYRLLSDKATGLSTTSYGQIALSLDTSGTLAGLYNAKMKASFEVI